MKKLVSITIAIFCAFALNAQVTLISWTFPTGTQADSLPSGALSMNATLGFRTGGGTSAINYGTNGLTNYCAQATNWDNGMNSKYWSVRFYSSGYNNLKISSVMRSGGTNPGPRDYKLQYRILPDVIWADVPNTTMQAANNWTGAVLNNVSLPVELENQAGIIELRWVMTSNTNTSGGTVTSNGICKIDNVTVTGTQMIGNVTGLVTYANTVMTPLRNVSISLLSGGNTVATAVTDTLGHYTFSNLAPGTYHIKCSSNSAWGGVNSSDALIILKHFVFMITLTGINLQAADVNNSGFINSSDALDVSKRFVGLITSFSAGDWVFQEFDVVVANGTVTQDVSGLCVGDVNGSFVPSN